MSNVLRAVDHLKKLRNVELTNSEICSRVAVSVKEEQESKLSVQEQHRSKRVRKYINYQEAQMDTQEESVVAGTKESDNCTAKGGKKKRKTRDALESSSKKLQKSPGGMDAVASTNDTAGTKVRKGKKLKSRKNRQKSNVDFEERCEQLLEFKDEFGHCNVPAKYSANIAFGSWCHKMRYNHNQKLKGKPVSGNIFQHQIKRLEEIGFQWKVSDHVETFEQRCRDLEAFKSEFGHCSVPRSYCEDPSLGTWCSTMRYSYHQKQQGKKPDRKLCQDRIDRLEKIGFRWKDK